MDFWKKKKIFIVLDYCFIQAFISSTFLQTYMNTSIHALLRTCLVRFLIFIFAVAVLTIFFLTKSNFTPSIFTRIVYQVFFNQKTDYQVLNN